MQIQWWYWTILGFCLIGLELIIPSFTIIWFGMSALLVAVINAFIPGISPPVQLFLWLLASVGFTLLWFRYLKPIGFPTSTGRNKDKIIGEIGTIICGTDAKHRRGAVRFHSSVLGADEWTCYSDEGLSVGDTVQVVGIEGNALKVIKV